MILILIPEVWTEEMKLFALHISYSTKLWFIHSFPYLFGPDPDPHFFADPDRAKTYGSVRIRIRIRNPAQYPHRLPSFKRSIWSLADAGEVKYVLRHRVGEGDTRVRLSGYGVELQVFVYVCLCASVCVSLCVSGFRIRIRTDPHVFALSGSAKKKCGSRSGPKR